MRAYLDCLPCFLSQALRAARTATDDEDKIKEILDEVGMMLRDIPLESGRLIYHKIGDLIVNPAPTKR